MRTGKPAAGARGRAVSTALLLCALLASIAGSPPGAARAEDGGTVLEGSGIQYPGGFDRNTVGELRGTAHGVERPERGPIRFRLDTENDTYVVLAAPAWYWEDLRTEIHDGAEVMVRGSKTLGRDMRLYIVAQEIRVLPSGQARVFRDEEGNPLWKAQGAGLGPGGGAGSPMFRGGGRGHGGAGGRRR